MAQIFPDDGSYTYKGIDLLDPTKVVPFEINPPQKLGTLTLNRNPSNYFSEPENVAFSPSNTVRGIGFVPDPLLQWRLMSYDDTQSHRHGSPNSYLLPINQPVVPVNNNFRDGYMQPLLYEGASTSSPDGIGGVHGASSQDALNVKNEDINGKIGRYGIYNDFFTQATIFWRNLDPYAQQHTVDAYRFELGHVADPTVQANYSSKILNNVDNCLARRVAFGIGTSLPDLISKSPQTSNTSDPSQFPLASTSPLSVAGLTVGILADDTTLSSIDLVAIKAIFGPQNLMYEIVAPHQGILMTSVPANQSYVTTSSISYDAVIIGSTTSNSSGSSSPTVQEFLREAYGHGKPLGAIGNGQAVFQTLGYSPSSLMGIFADSSASTLASNILTALESPRRYPQRQPLDDASICT
ncbi:hypothetical protein MMC14_002049 [Varicellaria rhodocarpa]|nr:hypothetical protein [Varicellaria rhodocarpa]